MSIRKEIKDYRPFMQADDFAKIVDDLRLLFDAAAQTAYEGFEPKEFIILMQKVYQENTNGKGAELKKNFMDDVKRVIGLYCSVGTKMTAKRISHTGEDGTKLWERLKSAFGIEDQPKDSVTVTIQRIVACFPNVVLCAYAADGGNGKRFRIPGGENQDMPYALHFSMAPSIIPDHADWSAVRAQYFKWALDFDRVINGDRADPEVLFGFYKIQTASSLFTPQQRVDWMKKVKINTEDYQLPDAADNEPLQRFLDGKLKPKSVTIPGKPGAAGGKKPASVKKL